MWRGAILGVAMAAGLASVAGPAQAQEVEFSLALIGNQAKDKQCSYIFDARNKLGVDLTSFKVRVYGLFANGTAAGLWVLPFSDLKAKKRQIKSFVLPMTCDKIASFYFEDFTECRGDRDYLDLCKKGLKLSSKIEVAFSNDAE